MRRMVGRWLGLVLSGAIVAWSLALTLVSPANALSVSDYFQISYQISISQPTVTGSDIFYAQVSGQATCKQTLPALLAVTQATITGQIVAQHKTNGVVDGIEKVLNPSYTITINPFPRQQGDIYTISQQISLQFPSGSPAGDYAVTGRLIQAQAMMGGLSMDVTSLLPQSYQSQTIGSVTYTAPSTPTPSPTPPPAPGGGGGVPGGGGGSQPTPTPAPTPTPSPTPVPTLSPTPRPTASPTPTSTPVPTPSPTPSPTSTPVPTPSPTPTMTPTPATGTPTPPPPVKLDLSDKIASNGMTQETAAYSIMDKQVALEIPKGTTVLTAEGKPLQEITAEKAPPETLPPAPGSNIIGSPYKFGPDGANFDPEIALTIQYDPGSIPNGIAEEDLVIAYYDVGTKRWVELPTTVDKATHTASAKVRHFTMFAVQAPAPTPTPIPTSSPVPTATPTPIVNPTPVPDSGTNKQPHFTISNLTITPKEVKAGERVEISALVSNDGNSGGTYTSTLLINGRVADIKELSLSSKTSQIMKFNVTKNEVGNYKISLEGQSGQFSVVEPASSYRWWWVALVGMMAVAGGAVLYALWRRRQSA